MRLWGFPFIPDLGRPKYACDMAVEEWGRYIPEEHELPYLRALGSTIRQLRKACGLSMAKLAAQSTLSECQIEWIEHAGRRTRHATLERIAYALAEGTDLDPGELTEHLVALAGPTLRPPATPWPGVRLVYAGGTDFHVRNRERRARQKAKQAAQAVSKAERKS